MKRLTECCWTATFICILSLFENYRRRRESLRRKKKRNSAHPAGRSDSKALSCGFPLKWIYVYIRIFGVVGAGYSLQDAFALERRIEIGKRAPCSRYYAGLTKFHAENEQLSYLRFALRGKESAKNRLKSSKCKKNMIYIRPWQYSLFAQRKNPDRTLEFL